MQLRLLDLFGSVQHLLFALLVGSCVVVANVVHPFCNVVGEYNFMALSLSETKSTSGACIVVRPVYYLAMD